MNSTTAFSHEAIARRAYQIWEAAGQPDGQDTAHWLQAEHELHGSIHHGDGARGRSVEPPAGPKHIPEKAPHSTNYVHPGVTTDSVHHQRHR